MLARIIAPAGSLLTWLSGALPDLFLRDCLFYPDILGLNSSPGVFLTTDSWLAILRYCVELVTFPQDPRMSFPLRVILKSLICKARDLLPYAAAAIPSNRT